VRVGRVSSRDERGLGAVRRVLLAVAVAVAGAVAAVALVGPVALTLPASAGAQTTSPLSPGFPQPSVSIPTSTTATPTIQTTATAGSGSGFTGSSAIIIAVGAIVVLGGISLYIWRDARRRAPKGHRLNAPIDAEGKRAGSKARQKPRKLSQAEKRRRKRGRAR
jgi:hypothetical protein